MCYAPDGWALNWGRGWKACGSIERYLTDIAEYNRRCQEWNRLHANRFSGMTIFGYGNWGWDSFELGDGEVILLNNWAQFMNASRLARVVALTDWSFTVDLDRDIIDPHAAYLSDLEAYLETANYIADDYREVLMRTLYQESA